MSNIKTTEELRNNFNKNQHNWQHKKLIQINDLSYILVNLLKEEFVVEIDGSKYDISFGKNEETGEIGYSWSSAPSPHLTSSEIIEKGFKNGKWYVVKKD